MKIWISKLRFAAFLLAVPVAGGGVSAQGPQCAAPQCAAPYYAPNCNSPIAGKQQSDEVAPGMFVAPQPNGDVQGESNTFGIHGPAIRFPESTIRLPSIQLPSLFKSRRGPELLTDQSRASFQSQPALQMQLTKPATGAKTNSDQVTPPNCTVPYTPCFGQNSGGKSDDIAQLQQQISQLTLVVGQLAALQQTNQVQALPVSAVHPAAYQSTRTAPAVEQRAVPSQMELQAVAQYEQKCREMTELQEQLASIQWEYQTLLESKQRQIVQQRDARMQKKLGESVDVAVESIPSMTESIKAGRVSPQPSPVAPAAPALKRPPLRLRGLASQSASTTTTVPAAETQDVSIAQASVSEDTYQPEDSSPVSGSRFGKWLKKGK